MRKFSNNMDLRKLDFSSEEKLSERSHFVNKDVMQSWFNKNDYKLFVLGHPVTILDTALTIYCSKSIPIVNMIIYNVEYLNPKS